VPCPLAAVPPLPDAHRPGGRWSLAVPRAPGGTRGAGRGSRVPEGAYRRGCHHPPGGGWAVPPKGVGASAAASGPGGPRSRWAREPRRVLLSREARGSRLRSPKTPESGGLSSRRGLPPPPRREGAPPGPVLRAGGSGESLAFRARRGFRPFPRHRSSSVCVDVRLGWCAVRPAGRSQRFSRAPTRVPPAPKRWASRRSGGAVPGCAGSRVVVAWSAPERRYRGPKPVVAAESVPGSTGGAVARDPPSAVGGRGPRPARAEARASLGAMAAFVGRRRPLLARAEARAAGVRRRSNRMGCHVKDRFRRTDPLG
jgi:hypothetical protein